MHGFLRIALCALVCLSLLTYDVFEANARSLPDSFADLVEDLMPAVVNISTKQSVKERQGGLRSFRFSIPQGSPFEDFRDFFEQLEPRGPGGSQEEDSVERKATSLGSGFVVSPEGYIVTNNHVVAEADEIMVTFSDDRQLEATIVGRDKKTDLAILKVESDKKLPYVSFGDSDHARVGDWVIAIGNPFGLGGSVSAGIISARARDINAGPFDDFIQTDAAINKGNSGGPLFDTRGKVIGINTAIFSPSGGSVGVGFAVPSALAEPVINQLKEHGRTFRGWLGVKIQAVSPDVAESLGLRDPRGALVVEVTKDSPADKAGMKLGDIILEFDGKEVTHMRKLPRLVAETEISKRVVVRVWRNGEREKLYVTLGELKENEEDTKEASRKRSDGSREPSGLVSVLGMKLVTLNSILADEFGIDNSLSGVLVYDVDAKTDAREKDIRPGDLITAVNQTPVRSTTELEAQLETARDKGRKSVLLLMSRGEEQLFIALELN